MKLKEYNMENSAPVRNGIALFSMNLKAGTITLNKFACALIGLSEGDQVLFHQDEEEPVNWYVEKVKEKGFLLRSNSGGTGVMFNNVNLARQIAASVEYDEDRGRCPIGGEPTMYAKRKLWGILLSALRHAKRQAA